MKRKCPACLKHIGTAGGMLIVLLLSLEAGLRLHHGGSTPANSELRDGPLVLPSSQCHHRLRPLTSVTIRHPDTNETVPLRTNSLGLRGGEIDVPKPPGTFRIVVLGDESILAPETPEEQTACRRLQRLLEEGTSRKVEVVNAGVPHYCPLLGYLLFKHSLLSLGPDVVVYAFDMTDVADDHRYRRYVRTGPGDGLLACCHSTLDDSARTGQHRRPRILLVEWARRQLGRVSTSGTSHNEDDDISSPRGQYAWVKDRPPDWSVHIQQALAPMAQLADLAAEVNARFLVAVVPAPWQVSAEASNTRSARERFGIPRNVVYRNRRPFEVLGRFLNEHEIPYCTPLPAFQESRNPGALFLNNVPRFSPSGHELFARELARTIQTRRGPIDSRGAPPRSTSRQPSAVPTSSEHRQNVRGAEFRREIRSRRKTEIPAGRSSDGSRLQRNPAVGGRFESRYD